MSSRFVHALGCASLLVCVGFSLSSAEAVPAKRPVAKKPAPKPMSEAEMMIGSISINHLDSPEKAPAQCRARFFRTMARTLYRNHAWLNRAKGEFETTEAYEKDLSELEAKTAALGTISTCWQLSDDHVELKYDADKGEFSGHTNSKVTVVRDTNDLGSVKGITNGGVRFTYDRETNVDYDIDYSAANGRFPDHCRYMPSLFRDTFGGFGFKFSYPVEHAAFLKGTGYLVIEANLIRPFIEYDRDDHTASLTERYESLDETLTVKARPLRVTVVDAVGKEVWSCSAT